jgi:hypothetical protein
MGQINFISNLIEKLSLGAQFELNWEHWNFRVPNSIFMKSIDWNQRQKCKTKFKVYCQLKVKLKKFKPRTFLKKALNFEESIWFKTGMKLKQIKNLMVNLLSSRWHHSDVD